MNSVEKEIEARNLEILWLVGRISCIASLIAAVLMLLGGGFEILWLCIISFVVAVVAIVVSWGHSFLLGPVTTLSFAIYFVASVFFKEAIQRWMAPDEKTFAFVAAIYDWTYRDGSLDVFYVSRVLGMFLVLLAVFQFVESSHASVDLRQKGYWR